MLYQLVGHHQLLDFLPQQFGLIQTVKDIPSYHHQQQLQLFNALGLSMVHIVHQLVQQLAQESFVLLPQLHSLQTHQPQQQDVLEVFMVHPLSHANTVPPQHTFWLLVYVTLQLSVVLPKHQTQHAQ